MKICLHCSTVLLPGEIDRNYCFGCRPPLEPAKEPPDFVRCRDCGLPLRKSERYPRMFCGLCAIGKKA